MAECAFFSIYHILREDFAGLREMSSKKFQVQREESPVLVVFLCCSSVILVDIRVRADSLYPIVTIGQTLPLTLT